MTELSETDRDALVTALHEAECTAYTHEGRNARCEREARALAPVVAALVADAEQRGREAAAVDIEAALEPIRVMDRRGKDAFRTGQGHLAPAFREVDWHEAFMTLAKHVTVIEEAAARIDRGPGAPSGETP